MELTIASARGRLATEFLTENRIVEELCGEFDVKEVRQHALAGPNDNIQFLLDWGVVAKAIKAAAASIAATATLAFVGEVSTLAAKDLYEHKRALLQRIDQRFRTFVGCLCRWARNATGEMPILLAAKYEKERGSHRNIAVDISGVDEDEVCLIFLAFATTAPKIVEFVETCETLAARSGAERQYSILWEKNQDSSIAATLRSEEFIVKYRQYFMGDDAAGQKSELKEQVFPILLE